MSGRQGGVGGTAATAVSEGAQALGLYVHFPWCVQKCPYCDFNSHALRETLPEAGYIDALVADLEAQLPRVAGRAVTSVFLGGGTPSLFAPAALARFFEQARARLAFAPQAEITLEANPATVERGRFAEYHAIGINRVSLGAQSFNPETLRTLGRIHQPADVVRAAEELHAAGLANFNLDLMYALPSQTLAGAVADLTCALALSPAHVSHYQLTLEPGTVFAARPPPLPDDDLAWAMQVECQGLLAAHGFGHYEVSAYARAGRQCVHNLTYWHFGDYLGLGAGAHGKLTQQGVVRRSTHLREPRRYLASAAGGPAWRDLPAADLPFEFMMNALRLTAGFEAGTFTAATGLPVGQIEPVLRRAVADGLLEAGPDVWRPSARGHQFLNDLVQRFLP